MLDHYLEVLSRKPGALPGAVALEQARASGSFTAAHERFWKRTRRKLGDREGTRALIEVLLLHRHLPFVGDGARRARGGGAPQGSVNPALVAIEARRIADGRRERSPSWSGRRCGASTARPHRPRRLRRAARRERPVSAPVTEQAAALTVEATSRALHLPTVRQQAASRSPRPRCASGSAISPTSPRCSRPNSTTATSAAASAASHARRASQRRLKRAVPRRLRPGGGADRRPRPCSPRSSAASGSPQGEPVVLLGDSGTGKSHLLIGLGMAACQRGLRVRYTTAAGGSS